MLLRRNRKFVGTRERLKRIVATFDSREANSDETRAQQADTRWFRAVASRAARNMGTRGQGSIPVNPWCQRSDRRPPAILWARTRRARLLTKWLGVLEAAVVL